jgi:RND family efflux transporter MFP subunit
VRGAETERERAQRDDELRIEERRRVAVAQADRSSAEGRVAELAAARDEAQLRLDRMTVRAPVDGVVLQRLASAGSTLFGPDHHVATLYDPRSVRVRVDVPQQDLARLFVGQETEIESDARPEAPYVGEVQRIVRRADIQKVTLQVHVRVVDADELLRPEMLVQVRFLAPAVEGGAVTAAAAVAVPEDLVDGGHAWVLDAEHGTATQRRLELGARADGFLVVTGGLDLSDKLLAPVDGGVLREGERVRPSPQVRGEGP